VTAREAGTRRSRSSPAAGALCGAGAVEDVADAPSEQLPRADAEHPIDGPIRGVDSSLGVDDKDAVGVDVEQGLEEAALVVDLLQSDVQLFLQPAAQQRHPDRQARIAAPEGTLR